MSKAIFFDCFSGISGDMLVGALLDAGLPLDLLSQELEKLGVKKIFHLGHDFADVDELLSLKRALQRGLVRCLNRLFQVTAGHPNQFPGAVSDLGPNAPLLEMLAQDCHDVWREAIFETLQACPFGVEPVLGQEPSPILFTQHLARTPPRQA